MNEYNWCHGTNCHTIQTQSRIRGSGENNDSFSISKIADTVEQATTYKLHLDALNDSKNKSYFIASDISTIIDKVVYHHNKHSTQLLF